jgi:hypothetical protein
VIRKIAGETPAPRKARVLCQFDDVRWDAVGSE